MFTDNDDYSSTCPSSSQIMCRDVTYLLKVYKMLLETFMCKCCCSHLKTYCPWSGAWTNRQDTLSSAEEFTIVFNPPLWVSDWWVTRANLDEAESCLYQQLVRRRKYWLYAGYYIYLICISFHFMLFKYFLSVKRNEISSNSYSKNSLNIRNTAITMSESFSLGVWLFVHQKCKL